MIKTHKHISNRRKIAVLLKTLRWTRFKCRAYAQLAKASAESGNYEKSMQYNSAYDHNKMIHAYIIDEIKILRRM